MSHSYWQLADDVAKTGRGHRVPLSRPALAVLDSLRPLTSSTPWVFVSPSPRAEGPESVLRLTPNAPAAPVTVKPSGSRQRDLSTSPGWGGLCSFIVGDP
jgi:hypothetical protein